MTKKEIIKELKERIEFTNKRIEIDKLGLKTKENLKGISFQEGYAYGLEVAIDYLENWLNKGE